MLIFNIVQNPPRLTGHDNPKYGIQIFQCAREGGGADVHDFCHVQTIKIFHHDHNIIITVVKKG